MSRPPDPGQDLFSSPPTPSPPPNVRSAEVIAVSELNRRVRNTLEARFELLWVSGELSNVMRATSGHWYFSLKDSAAQVRCVMFRNRAAAIGFAPENGMQVEVRALPSLYEPRGEFQLGVENMRRAGLGAMYEAFERLKARLQAEGLFADERRRALPSFPKTIGIVTSLKAAALRDVLTTLRRRAPIINVIIYPAAVQGAGAAAELAAAIDAAQRRVLLDRIDALIVCRGGGSIEDLWPFNEEAVARAIVRFQQATAIPVVSGVGHETDFTICDFVADRRAPTPTAAAELLSPDVLELRMQTQAVRARLKRAWRRVAETASQRLDRAARNLVSPAERLARARERLALSRTRLCHVLASRMEAAGFELAMLRQRHAAHRPDIAELRDATIRRRARLETAAERILKAKAQALDTAAQALLHLNPQRVLARGYGIVTWRGAVLRDAQSVKADDDIRVQLGTGALAAKVTGVLPDD